MCAPIRVCAAIRAMILCLGAPPCRCMCHECAQELRKQTSKCPICRNQVESLLHIKVSRLACPRARQGMRPVQRSRPAA